MNSTKVSKVLVEVSVQIRGEIDVQPSLPAVLPILLLEKNSHSLLLFTVSSSIPERPEV